MKQYDSSLLLVPTNASHVSSSHDQRCYEPSTNILKEMSIRFSEEGDEKDECTNPLPPSKKKKTREYA